MKNYLTPILPLIFTLASYGNIDPGIDEQVVTSFNYLFPSANNIKWNETPDAYVVHFTDSGNVQE